MSGYRRFLVFMVFCVCMMAGCHDKNTLDNDQIENGRYVTTLCVYISPLSSWMPLGEDSGYVYQIEDGQFTITARGGSCREEIPVEEWTWQDFPYTNEEWAEMLVMLEAENPLDTYEKKLYLPLSEEYELMKMDDQLWIAEKRGTQIWSVFRLAPEGSMGTAQWTYVPGSKEDTVSFSFDVDCEQISVFSTAGEITGEDGERGMNLTLTQTKEVQWSKDASEAKIYFYVYGDTNRITYSGAIYLSGEKADDGSIVYEIQLACGGLRMEQDKKTGSIIIQQ